MTVSIALSSDWNKGFLMVVVVPSVSSVADGYSMARKLGNVLIRRCYAGNSKH